MIDGVILKDLIVHKDRRGKLFEILRSDEKIFVKFGQAYVTVCNPGWVKAWHYHKNQIDNFCVIRGKARIVLYDLRAKSTTYRQINEFVLSDTHPKLLIIPKGVVHGFESIGKKEAWILNLPTKPYNRTQPDEYRLPVNSDEVPYKPWKNKKGW
ncbi:MAG: dTDP-4-dehydrorhamnose 3,5-epimerase family protein [Elusimicrobiota bacterium]|nr:dTDP-4-dehydrorhamnose 3,5-epimerase family protein [Elusimicrobiota bacterium]